MVKPFGYIDVASYADSNRIPAEVVIEKLKSGRLLGKQVGEEWFVSEDQIRGASTGGSENEAPIIILILNIAAVLIFLLSLIISLRALPAVQDAPGGSFIFPVVILASGVFSSLFCSAIAKGLSLLHSINLSLSKNA